MKNTTPLSRTVLIRKLNETFTAKERTSIVICAGAALVLHGIKKAAMDVDAFVDTEEVLKTTAHRLKCPTSKSILNHALRVEVDGWCELFYDPKLRAEYVKGIITSETQIAEWRVDSPDALVNWYRMMVQKRGLQKDYDHLKMALSLAESYR